MHIAQHTSNEQHDPSTSPLGPPASRRRRWRLVIAVLALLALAVPDAGAVAGPLEHGTAMADPSVAKVGPQRYVAVATGPNVRRLISRNGMRWRPISPALATRPAWARPGSAIWAADLVHVRRRWLLYFAAPVRGMGETSRCIGVAAARTSTGRFRPVGRRPLVCPPAARAPRAEDRILDRRRARPTLPTIGAIDPSAFVDRGRVFLLYKTDGKPSSIRILRLRANGLHARGRSRALLTNRGVVENPVMVRRGRWLYLFMSAGDYSRCSYSTVWRRSRNVFRWRNRPQRTLLARRSTGLCGPGGADVVVDRRSVRLYFHAWTCRRSGRPCAASFHMTGRTGGGPVRALYGARLRFSRRAVRVASYIRPHTQAARHHAQKKRHHARAHHARRHHVKRQHVKRQHHAQKHRKHRPAKRHRVHRRR
ncbi:family 43 glycosylhydrolase [Nocardioides sp. CER19]|uniref:family 43 glycosylhydrolase n=1 Tax=Nocardioides sp. CER19 TaxID=3038538 RepID=UPI002449FE24|nr:family 43 glycosylhydrolase [Nocardioides sp. CER19]MDH2413186.1 family 43 glycosylhydrolase [Nocardioides sp. CER19]